MISNLEGKRGITLVALVITIIVLLILAGVAINYALGKDRIMKKTMQSTEAHKKAQLQEQLNLELAGIKMNMISGSNYSLEDIANILGGIVEEGKIIVEREGYIFTIEDLTIVDVALASMTLGFNPNGVDGVQTISTVLTVENNKGVVDSSTLQYGWSNAKDVQPTEWTSFTSGETITKNIAGSTQVYFVWIKAKDTQGNEQIKRSGQFNDVDDQMPTVVLSKTGDTVGSTNVEITAVVTYGFTGVKTVKWLGGIRVEADFQNAGEVMASPYKFTVTESGNYTVYIEGNNGKKAVSTIQVVNIVTTGWQAGVPNVPILVEGMIPIKWNGTTWIVTNTNDPDWYNYIDNIVENATTSDVEAGQECRRWANIMLSDGTYKANTVTVGQTVTDAQLGSMFVWLPRYTYKITKGEHTATTGAIAIKWSNGIADNTSGGYIAHPAFKFGNDELKGIWVSKFEATNSSSNIKIVPNIESWHQISVSSMFTTCRNMEKTNVYGWTAQTGVLNANGSITDDSNNFDTHMMKNVEWGAVAYLTHSIGKTGEVARNADTNYHRTGGGSNGAYKTNITQSTTHNVYGIYDMNGGAKEYVAAYLDNSYAISSGNNTSLVNAEEKYKDIYAVGSTDNATNNYLASAIKYGDAVYETSSSSASNTSWFGRSAYFPYSSFGSMFSRGGSYSDTTTSGLFSFFYGQGNAATLNSFRPVLSTP
jgi:hypothetical protein